MSGYLLAISIGPVQDFIAAARRTRDLWFGSHVLSEISKAAARAVANAAETRRLVFPAPNHAADLEPDSKLIVANIVLAELPPSCDPRQVSEEAKQAAIRRWCEFAEQARADAGDAVRQEIWREQVSDVVEFYAAWQPLSPEASYRDARRQVMRTLSGRKACRDFQESHGRAGVPKSSLDGARESVFKKQSEWPTHIVRKLRINEGEQLDVIGLTKRLATKRPYPSVARIAAEPWIRRIVERAQADSATAASFQELRTVCCELGADVIHRIDDRQFPQFAPFPFEGTTVFRQRHRELANETEVRPDELRQLADAVKRLVDPPREDGRGGLGFGEPSPYLAVLVADGDRMGAVISEIESADVHRRFSRELAQFADQAHRVVEDDNRGVCVYAGGDDVLAFLPLDSCLACARELHAMFGQLMGGWTSVGVSPTLSVGIAVGHFMEPLEDLLAFGREAESAAKKQCEDGQNERNALAVMYRPRGGAPVSVRDNWSSIPPLVERLSKWGNLFAERRLPNKLPYDLRQLGPTYQRWSNANLLEIALRADVKRLLMRKETKLRDEDQDFVRGRVDAVNSVAKLERLAREMYVAQSIAVQEVNS
jgi:CRISPR-associated protein Cmr2